MQATLIFHNLMRWAIILFGLWTVLNALTGIFSKRIYSPMDNRTNLFFMISCDIQLLLGLALYFGNLWYQGFGDMATTMKDTNSRFFTVEHTTMMLLAWVLVHVGRVVVKKATSDTAKHKRSLIYFGLVMVLIFAAIPWPFRELIGRPWFRWFN